MTEEGLKNLEVGGLWGWFWLPKPIYRGFDGKMRGFTWLGITIRWR